MLDERPHRPSFARMPPAMTPPLRLIAALAVFTVGIGPAAAANEPTAYEYGTDSPAVGTVSPGNVAGAVQVAQADALPENYAASVEVRLSQMETQIRALTGRVEELQYELQRVNGQLQRSMADVEFRLDGLEGSGTATAGGPTASASAPSARTGLASDTVGDLEPAPQTVASALDRPSASIGPTYDSLAGQATTQPPGPVGTLGTLTVRGDSPEAGTLLGGGTGGALPQSAAVTAGGPTELFDFAYRRLQTSDYDGAEQAFRQMVDSYPQHEMVSQARYWLGESFYMRGRFDDAARAYAESYRGDPGGPKAVDSLLKLGMSLAATGQRSDACSTFARLYAEFPSAPTSIRRRADQERSRLQCP